MVVGWTIQVDIDGLLQPILWKLDIGATLNLKGFQLFRRNRVAWEHVGACMYIKNSMQCCVLFNPWNEYHKVPRVDIKPRRLARNFSNIIEGVLYQPPNADDNAIKHYFCHLWKVWRVRCQLCYYFSWGFQPVTITDLGENSAIVSSKACGHRPARRDGPLDQI